MLTKKKLPFKATALYDRAPAKPGPDASDAASCSKKDDNNNNNSNDDDGLDLFRQSKAMAPILAADREKKLLKKKNKQKLEQRKAAAQARRISSASLDDHGANEDRRQDHITTHVKSELRGASGGDKRNRDLDEELLEGGDTVLPGIESSTPLTPPGKRSRLFTPLQTSRSPKRQRSVHDSTPLLSFRTTPSRQSSQQTPLKPRRSVPLSGTPVISLLSDSEDDVPPPRLASHKKPAFRVETPSQGSTHFGGAVITEATPTRRWKHEEQTPQGHVEDNEGAQESAVKRPPLDGQGRDEDTNKNVDENEAINPTESFSRDKSQTPIPSTPRPPKQEQPPPPPPPQPPVSILVRSEIPKTKTILVKYIYAKPLRILRDSWIAAQVRNGVHFPTDQDADFVMTWCRRIVFPTSSLQTLNIHPPTSPSSPRAAHNRAGFTPDGLKVLIEMWTRNGYEEMKRLEDQQRRRDAGDFSEHEDSRRHDAADDDDDDESEQLRLKVILKAQGLDPTNLTVLPETPMRMLVEAFRKQRRIPPERHVEVRFDGDVVRDDQTMEDLGIEDLDSMDVYVS